MFKFNSFFIIFLLLVIGSVHGIGIKNLVLCMENDGVLNLEFSSDGDCCGHSNSHTNSKSFEKLSNSDCEDYVLTPSTQLQKSEKPPLKLGVLLAILETYFTHQAPEKLVSSKVISNDFLPSTIEHRSITVLLI